MKVELVILINKKYLELAIGSHWDLTQIQKDNTIVGKMSYKEHKLEIVKDFVIDEGAKGDTTLQ